jgi:hypothetical protein
LIAGLVLAMSVVSTAAAAADDHTAKGAYTEFYAADGTGRIVSLPL